MRSTSAKWILLILSASINLVPCAARQAEARETTDNQQIYQLLDSISRQSRLPSDLLDPTLSQVERTKNLHVFGHTHYDLMLTPVGQIYALNGHRARVTARVQYDDGHGNTANLTANVSFVKVGNNWYFSTYDFMNWPAGLTIVVVTCCSIGVGYAALVILLMRRLALKHPDPVPNLLAFIPMYWPRLFPDSR